MVPAGEYDDLPCESEGALDLRFKLRYFFFKLELELLGFILFYLLVQYLFVCLLGNLF